MLAATEEWFALHIAQSARGLAHSKTLRAVERHRERASVLECGGPPPLFFRATQPQLVDSLAPARSALAGLRPALRDKFLSRFPNRSSQSCFHFRSPPSVVAPRPSSLDLQRRAECCNRVAVGARLCEPQHAAPIHVAGLSERLRTVEAAAGRRPALRPKAPSRATYL
jgi:hypothetical protein